jgi:hypothetical protein
MGKKYGFRTFEDATSYAERNYYRDTYKIIETNSGKFAIEKIFNE